MRCVKLTLPPRERARWLLTTTRLSMSSLAGTARTLVAVGTVSETSMLATTREGAPRRGVTMSSLTGPVPLTAGMSRGLGASEAGSSFGSLFGSALATGAVATGAFTAGAGATLGSLFAAGAGAGAGGALVAGAPLADPFADRPVAGAAVVCGFVAVAVR